MFARAPRQHNLRRATSRFVDDNSNGNNRPADGIIIYVPADVSCSVIGTAARVILQSAIARAPARDRFFRPRSLLQRDQRRFCFNRAKRPRKLFRPVVRRSSY